MDLEELFDFLLLELESYVYNTLQGPKWNLSNAVTTPKPGWKLCLQLIPNTPMQTENGDYSKQTHDAGYPTES